MTIKTEITKKETIEQEVALPYFFKIDFHSGAWHCAVFDEKHSLIVKPEEIQTHSFAECVLQFINDENVVVTTEEEFTEAFETTMNHIQSMIPVTK